jgi:hypothetical protein
MCLVYDITSGKKHVPLSVDSFKVNLYSVLQTEQCVGLLVFAWQK